MERWDKIEPQTENYSPFLRNLSGNLRTSKTFRPDLLTLTHTSEKLEVGGVV
jgi:hypothetical protein